MAPVSSSQKILKFENFELDLRAGELYKGGRKIKLQDLPLKILAILLETPGGLVTRDELREKLWAVNTFVDFDHSLNTAIRKLRRALNDRADKPRFIETLPRRGYRFLGVAKIESTAADAKSPSPAAEPPSGEGKWPAGTTLLLRGDEGYNFVCLPSSEDALKEKEKLEAANDNLGLSMLSAARKLLVVPSGTRVKVLEPRPDLSCCEVRILQGEFTGETAFVPGKYLRDA